jgi:hypothetical protein
MLEPLESNDTDHNTTRRNQALFATGNFRHGQFDSLTFVVFSQNPNCDFAEDKWRHGPPRCRAANANQYRSSRNGAE